MKSEIQYPIALSFYWGSELDPQDVPATVEFQDQAHHEAYLHGLSEADGWMEVNFVGNGAYYVNKDGDFVERRGADISSKPTSRYVIWGEHPERGTRAQVYDFQTEAQAQAFEDAATEMVGWTRWHVVPSPDFKPYASLQAAIDALGGDASQSLRAYAEHEGLELDAEDEYWFVRADGALVRGDYWAPGGPPDNQPLSLAQYRQCVDQVLENEYGHQAQEVGLDDAMLSALHAGPLARFPKSAAHQFAQDKGLTLVSRPAAPSP